jgi:hypothetical protein
MEASRLRASTTESEQRPAEIGSFDFRNRRERRPNEANSGRDQL